MLSTVAIPVAEEGRVKADYKQGLSLQYNQEVILAQHGVKYKRTFPTENHVTTGGKDEEPPESLKLGGGAGSEGNVLWYVTSPPSLQDHLSAGSIQAV